MYRISKTSKERFVIKLFNSTKASFPRPYTCIFVEFTVTVIDLISNIPYFASNVGQDVFFFVCSPIGRVTSLLKLMMGYI